MAKWLWLPNGTGARADQVAGASYHEETLRIFLKNAAGDTLCTCVCPTAEDAAKTLADIRLLLG